MATLWITDISSPETITAFDTIDGAEGSTLATTGYVFQDITWDGTRLIGILDTAHADIGVYEIQNGNLVYLFDCPVSTNNYGIAWDGSGFLFTNTFDSFIYRTDSSGVVTDTYNFSSFNFFFQAKCTWNDVDNKLLVNASLIYEFDLDALSYTDVSNRFNYDIPSDTDDGVAYGDGKIWGNSISTGNITSYDYVTGAVSDSFPFPASIGFIYGMALAPAVVVPGPFTHPLRVRQFHW